MEMYAPLHVRLCRYVQTLVWNSDDAKDLISDTTLIAYEKFDTLKDTSQFLYFLFGIAHKLYLKSFRRNKFKGAWLQSKMEEKASNYQTDGNLMKQELHFWLSKLNPQAREMLTLFEISGFSYAEIAQIQGVTEQKVKATLYQSRQQLKWLIEKEKGEGK